MIREGFTARLACPHPLAPAPAREARGNHQTKRPSPAAVGEGSGVRELKAYPCKHPLTPAPRLAGERLGIRE